MLYAVGAIVGLVIVAFVALVPFFLFLIAAESSLALVSGIRGSKYLLMMFRTLRRNLLRTSLTYLAIFVLVVVVTLVWSVLWFLDLVTTEKSKDLKAVVTERWQIPSQMPFSYAVTLEDGAAERDEDLRPENHMTWQFYGATLDPTKRTRENSLFFFAMEADKLKPMMDDLAGLDDKLVEKLKANKRGCILGREKLEAINKRVGETFNVTSINYKDIDLEFEIVGLFPEGRYNQNAVMNREYLNDALDAYYRAHGKKHPMADRTLNLVWLRVPDPQVFQKVAEQVMTSSRYKSPAVKCETASSGISTFLDAYRDLIWGMRWLLIPAILAAMCLVVANSISISVRERRSEMAVLKVLGFRPWQILTLVLGEALLIGGASGLISAGITYAVINGQGGLKFPIAFFPSFMIPGMMVGWGLVIGATTALLGSLWPAWSARTVKVSEVFAKIA
jgi:putative ABC transport system permease protein